MVNLGCLPEATVTGSLPPGAGRGIPDDILWNPATNDYKTVSTWHEYGLPYNATEGGITKENPLWWQVEWPTAKNINYITCTGSYANQPQPTTGWAIQIQIGDEWQDLARIPNGWDADTLRGAGYGSPTQTNWLWNGMLEWRGLEPVVTTGVRFTAYANPDSLADGRDSFADSLWSFIWTGRPLEEGGPKSVLIQYLDFSAAEADNKNDEMVNLALLEEAVVSASFAESTIENIRGQPTDILYDPVKDDYHNTNTAWAEFGYPWQYDAGYLTHADCFYWMVEWPVAKHVNYFSWGGVYPNQPQPDTPWAVEYWDSGWVALEEGVGGSFEEGDSQYPYHPGVDKDAHSIWMAETPITTKKLRLAVWSDGVTPLQSFHLRARGGTCLNTDDSENPFKAVLVQYKPVTAVTDTVVPTLPQSIKPDFSHKRGFYNEPFDLTLSAASPDVSIRYTSDCSKPDRDTGMLYTEPIHITGMKTIRAVAYEDSMLCSEVRTHSYIFPADVLVQDDSRLPLEQHAKDHVFWTEEFDMSDVTQSESEMIRALLDIPTIYVSASYDSIFGIAGIHRGQNLERHGGDPVEPGWNELVECSVEMIYPETYRNGRIKNWQENCGIQVQGGAGRWQNGHFDHKQSFTLKFKKKFGTGMLKNDILISAPFNHESVPDEYDKIIIRTGFNRDWGSDWDRGNTVYTRDQFGRDLQIMMSGWGCHGTYAHLYINGKYWGQYNPCERMDDHALASYFGGEDEDYFYGKGKEGVRQGSRTRYNTLTQTDWTDRQLSEIAEYLAIDTYIDVALVHCYSNAGDCPQYYYGGRVNPPGPIYYSAWDIEDSFDGGARRSGPPVSMETYNMPNVQDRFKAYFRMKNNIDFKMKFADRVYQHCFNDGILTDDRVVAVWDSSCKVIEKSILCEIARWGDERGEVYDYEHWKKECKDVRDDLIGRADLLVDEIRKSGMYPIADPPAFEYRGRRIRSSVLNCEPNSSLTVSFMYPQSGQILYTTDGTDPRTWDLTGNISESAIEVSGVGADIPITQTTTIKARIKDSDTWSPLRELKIIPNTTSRIVINEINYDSYANFDTEDWVELYNNSSDDICLDGWKLKDSKDDNVFEFGPGTLLRRDSYLVVCRDKEDFKDYYENVVNCIGDMTFKFSNDGESVRLFDANNALVDIVTYGNTSPWPAAAAGKGATLELINPEYDNGQPENWKASRNFGSPGRRNHVGKTTAIQPENDSQDRPEKFSLSQNYPNPFNPTTHIDYQLATAGLVSLKIFTITGQTVTTLVDGYQDRGKHSIQWIPDEIASGIYIYQLRTAHFSATRKLVFMK